MNWAALVVVTGLSTLFMLIQFVANQRQFDFNLDDPLERPVNQPSPRRAACPASPAQLQPAIRSSSPNRHRGIDLTFEARSPDDDCSSSYLLNKPLHPPCDPPTPTTSGCAQYLRNAGSSLVQQPGSDGDCTGRRQPSETDCYKLGGTTSCISDQSIYCGGGGSRNLNDGRRRAHGSISSPCQSYGDGASASPRSSFECDAQSTRSETNAVDHTGTGRGRRCATDAVEIVGAICDDDNVPEGDAGEAGEDCDPQPPVTPQCSPRQRMCERTGLGMSSWIDIIVRVLFILFLLVLLFQFINRVLSRKYGWGGGNDDDGMCKQAMTPCSRWMDIQSAFGFDNHGCGCRKK